MNGVSALTTETPHEELPLPFCHVRTQQEDVKMAVCEPESGLSLDTKLLVPDLGLPSVQNCKKYKFLLFTSPFVHGISVIA